MLGDVVAAAGFFAGVPAFVRTSLTDGAARAALEQRLRWRAEDFLALARSAIYGSRASPYRALLALAGCEFGDLEILVRREGVEGALGVLYRAGVYLTLEEFKGRRPARRGKAVVAVDPAHLEGPRAPHVRALTSGSRGPRTAIPLGLPAIHDRAVNTRLTLAARGGLGWRHAYWGAPGAYVTSVLRCQRAGTPLEWWCSQVDPHAPGLAPRYRLSAAALRAAGALAAWRPPRLEVVSLEDPGPLLDWMARTRRAGATPHLYTYVSPALRLAQAALGSGRDLEGAALTVTGEPLTATRLAALRRAGADVGVDYGCVEAGGFVSYGCLAPQAPDDVHLFDDLVALIQPGPPPGPLPPQALLLTALRPQAPLVLLNVSTGDEAAVARRACGCPLEGLGWPTHLQAIRSFAKVTAGGMTFAGTDVAGVLDTVLPARFGGGPSHYQLVEEERADGQPRLRLLVHPAVGPFDPAVVADVFLAAIGRGSPTARQMELHWRQAAWLAVERRPPLTTPTGKVLYLVGRPAAAGPGAGRGG